MMRSLYSGVSGLKNHQIRMDVIGNNISNVNTYGFKSERVTFQDMISQTMAGASEPKDNVGGVNPKQIGLGTMTAAIDKMMHQGSLQTTNKNTDVAIAGEGFFVLGDGDKKFYTRAGNFDVDKDGRLVNPANGMKVQGWNSQAGPDGNKSINATGSVEDLIIPLYQKEPAKETSYVVFKSNLNSAALAVPADASDETRYEMIKEGDVNKRRGHIMSMDVFDAKGEKHVLQVFSWKNDQNRWSASVGVTNASNLTVDVLGPQNQNTTRAGNTRFELTFTPDGRINSVSDGADSQTSGQLSADVSFRIPGIPEVQTVKLRLGEAGQVNGVTQYASTFTTKMVEQDGKPMGYMESFKIDNSGTITGVYSNGSQQPLGRIAMAIFTNPEGLTKAGENNYIVSNNSGDAQIGEANVQGRGSINAGMLEMSNVDLSDQFTDMIVTQRGFQANSRSITTSDQMIQELLTLKR